MRLADEGHRRGSRVLQRGIISSRFSLPHSFKLGSNWSESPQVRNGGEDAAETGLASRGTRKLLYNHSGPIRPNFIHPH
jgi:hypothetical protein